MSRLEGGSDSTLEEEVTRVQEGSAVLVLAQFRVDCRELGQVCLLRAHSSHTGHRQRGGRIVAEAKRVVAEQNGVEQRQVYGVTGLSMQYC